MIHLVVKDFGKGIPEEILKDIFTKGFKYEKTNSIDNFGLGLSFCKTIIEDYHQGKIWSESKIDEYSDFHIQIPV